MFLYDEEGEGVLGEEGGERDVCRDFGRGRGEAVGKFLGYGV